MKKLVLVFLIICPIELFGQSFVMKQPLRMPNKYLKPSFKTLADYKPTIDLSNQFWNVWIDRKGVTTTNGKMPKFVERFLVVEEKDSKIHIVKDNGTFNNSVGEFDKEPEDFGWVGKEFCILSPFAIYSAKTNFRIKVMTITTPEMMQKEMARIREGAKKLAFYDSPVITTPNDNETPLFEIFYVLKKEGGRYLLSKRENISKGFSENYINGWVDTSSVQLWEQRQSLEPNWDSDAAAERQKENVKSSVFSNKAEAEAFATSKNGLPAFWNDDRYSVRYGPYFKRFPVFSQNGNIVETAVVSDLVQEDGKKVKNDAIVEIQELYNVQKQKSRNINLIFVIDGTQSMGPYIESVRKAVIESAASIQSSDNTFSYGAVIYRDYIKPENDECYMVQQLTDYNKFSKFMVTVDTEEPACKDKTTSEGLYMGLKKVDGILRGKEQQTNIIILIGDCGDREGDGRVTEPDVLPLLKKYSCSILSMQVHSSLDPSYEDFVLQAKEIGLKNAVELSLEQKQKYGKLNLSSLNNRPRYVEKSEKEKTLYTLVFGPVSGALQRTKKGDVISEKEVNSEIKRIITSTDIKNDSMLNELTKLVNSAIVADPTKESGLSAEGLQILMKAGFSMEQINILKQKNYQFMLRGNTPIKIQNMKTPLYNYVLFLDQAELDDIKISLDKLYIPGQTAFERRAKLADAWRQLLISNYGVTRSEMENKTFAELMGYITGLPSLNPLLQKYTIEDIEDKIKLPDDDFDGITNQIKTKRDELSRISGNKAFMFLSNDLAYYWIPQRSLP